MARWHPCNVLDEMRDSPQNSESSRDDIYDADKIPPYGKRKNRRKGDESSFLQLADSIQNSRHMTMGLQKEDRNAKEADDGESQAEIVKIRQDVDVRNKNHFGRPEQITN